jgi:hypothetical protein
MRLEEAARRQHEGIDAGFRRSEDNADARAKHIMAVVTESKTELLTAIERACLAHERGERMSSRRGVLGPSEDDADSGDDAGQHSWMRPTTSTTTTTRSVSSKDVGRSTTESVGGENRSRSTRKGKEKASDYMRKRKERGETPKAMDVEDEVAKRARVEGSRGESRGGSGASEDGTPIGSVWIAGVGAVAKRGDTYELASVVGAIDKAVHAYYGRDIDPFNRNCLSRHCASLIHHKNRNELPAFADRFEDGFGDPLAIAACLVAKRESPWLRLGLAKKHRPVFVSICDLFIDAWCSVFALGLEDVVACVVDLKRVCRKDPTGERLTAKLETAVSCWRKD